MVDLERKYCHFLFKVFCGPKTKNCGKYFILLVTVLFIGKEWLSLLALLKTNISILFQEFILDR